MNEISKLGGVYVNGAAVLALLKDIKQLWDVHGFGDEEQVSEPLYNRLNIAITELEDQP